jgi:hypothetical protein
MFLNNRETGNIETLTWLAKGKEKNNDGGFETPI